MESERDYSCALMCSTSVILSLSPRISSTDFHRSEKFMVTASNDESIRLYDFQNAMWLKTINSKKYGVDLVSFTDHPTTVIYSSKNGWNESLPHLSLNDNKYLRYFKGHHDRVVSLSWCPWKDYFISGSLDRTVLLWDQRAEKSQGLLRVQGRPAVSYDDRGMVFAIAFGGYIRMLDTRIYEKGPFGNFSEANVVKFSNDGRKMLLTTMGGHIHVLRLLPRLRGSGDGCVYGCDVTRGTLAYWGKTDMEAPPIKWAPGSLLFASGSSELIFWTPDLSKLGAFGGMK